MGVGALSCAILVVNNLRDIPADTVAGKRTLAVRLGDARTRGLYEALIWAALLVPALIGLVGLTGLLDWPVAALAGLGALALALVPLRDVRAGALGAALVPVLGATGRLLLGYGVLLAAGIGLGAVLAG